MNAFEFNPAAVKFRQGENHGKDVLFASLRMPDGRVLEVINSWSKGWSCGRHNAERILLWRLECKFERVVANLSAHDKMIWKKNSH